MSSAGSIGDISGEYAQKNVVGTSLKNLPVSNAMDLNPFLRMLPPRKLWKTHRQLPVSLMKKLPDSDLIEILGGLVPGGPGSLGIDLRINHNGHSI